MAETFNIAWIGTGVMGKHMCSHLMKAGHKAFIYNRTKDKAKELILEGATWCDSPGEAAKQADIVFTIVGYPKDVEEVYLGEDGILANVKDDAIVVDMTTSNPALAQQIYEAAKARNVYALDAPVTGGDVGAREAKLTIMVGGDEQAFERVRPLFESMSKSVTLMGPAGSGQHTKMANQIAIAGSMIVMVESLIYAKHAGLDLETVHSVLGSGSAASFSFTNMGRRVLDDNFEPGFYIKHFIKDMGIALAECKRMNIQLPGLELVKKLYDKAQEMGLENKGTQALYKVLDEMNR